MVRGVELSRAPSLVPDLLAGLLHQLGYAVVPPRRPEGVLWALDQAGQRVEALGLYEATDLEPWQPCIVSLRLSPRQTEQETPAGAAHGDRCRPAIHLEVSTPQP